MRSARTVLVGAGLVVFVAVVKRRFDWIWCEEFRCRRDTALAERVSAPHRLSDHEAAEDLEDGVLLDAFSHQQSFGRGGMAAGSAALARHRQQAYGHSDLRTAQMPGRCDEQSVKANRGASMRTSAEP